MCEYKVFNWNFDSSTSEDLENKLNEYGKDGWKVIKIVTNLKGSGNFIIASLNENEATIILEREV